MIKGCNKTISSSYSIRTFDLFSVFCLSYSHLQMCQSFNFFILACGNCATEHIPLKTAQRSNIKFELIISIFLYIHAYIQTFYFAHHYYKTYKISCEQLIEQVNWLGNNLLLQPTLKIKNFQQKSLVRRHVPERSTASELYEMKRSQSLKSWHSAVFLNINLKSVYA